MNIGETRVICPTCGRDVFVTVQASSSVEEGQVFIDLSVTSMSGCPHANQWRPDPKGGVPVSKVA